MLYVINFADQNFYKQQKTNSKTAYEKGKGDLVIEYNENDLADLKNKYPNHFKIKRGFGLWFWKPYFILKTMELMHDDDYLFYCDSGAIFIDDIHKLIPDLNSSEYDIMFFEQPLLARCFTKKETYYLLNYNDFSGNQLLGGYIFLKKSNKTIKYMKEWLNAMSDLRVLSPEKFLPDIIEDKKFISHREDQSVLTILCKKWGIQAYRDPSDFGIFPWQYMRAGGYHSKKYPNSHYPTILLCVRRNDPIEYEKNYYKALKKYKMGLNNEFIARFKLLPMYIKHWVRILCEKIGMGGLIDIILDKSKK